MKTFEIVKDIGNGRPQWRLSHIPTDRNLGSYGKRKIAAEVRDAILERVPAAPLASDDIQIVKTAILDAMPEFPHWMVEVQRGVSYAEIERRHARQIEVDAQITRELEDLKKYRGRKFWITNRSPQRYGYAGEVTGDPSPRRADNGEIFGIYATIEWTNGSGATTTPIDFDAVEWVDEIPADLPWYHGNNRLIVRINHSVFVVERFGVDPWRVRSMQTAPNVEELHTTMKFGDRDAAVAFVEKWATV